VIDNPEPFWYNTAMLKHDYSDFAMTPTFALMNLNSTFGVSNARVYSPNPWHPTEVRYYDWLLYDDGIWRRTSGGTFHVDKAREDWKHRKGLGHIPRDVIANPLNDDGWADCDEWASHFAGDTRFFFDLIKSYNNDYPRKKVG